MIPTWNYTTISTELSEMILKRKNDYYRHLSDKLNHPETSAKLNYNKTHFYDDISIRLLKICDSSAVKPLSIIFKNCLQSGDVSGKSLML